MFSNDLIPEKVLIFDIKGPMAHFRKYYTNSSSLSYLFPPRTVVVGLIAGLLGLPSERHTKEKESIYYERFGYEQCLVAVSMRSKIRKMMQKLNYNFTKTESKEISFSKHSQIPLEILLSEDDDDITYRVYFYYKNEDGEWIYHELKRRLEAQMFIFPPYMGITEFLASIEYIGEGKVSRTPKQEVELNTVCRLGDVELDFSGEDLQYLTEKMPTGFSNDRTPKQTSEYVLEVKGRVMKVKLKEDTVCYTVSYPEDDHALTENIMFM